MVIPEGVQEIGEQWFENSHVESVALPASVMAIESEAFRGCKGLRRVEFAAGSKLEKIGFGCFSGSGLIELSFPEGLTEIGAEAFDDCVNLKTVWV